MTRAEQLAHYTNTAAALSQGDRIAQLEAALTTAYESICYVMHLLPLPQQLAMKSALDKADAALGSQRQGSGTT